MVVFRWIVFFPAAVLSAQAIIFLVAIGNKFSIIDDSFSAHVFIVFASNLAGGVAYILIGARIVPSPSHRAIVAYILTCVGFAFGGFALFQALMISDYWAIWAIVCTALGFSTATYGVWQGEIFE